MNPVSLYEPGPVLLVAVGPSGQRLGWARRVRGRWVVYVRGGRMDLCRTKRGAARALADLASKVLEQQAIRRAGLHVRRPDGPDLMALQTGRRQWQW